MRGLYVRLEALSREQAGLIAALDTDGLLGLLGRRQRLVERIGSVAAELEPYRRRWGAVVGSLGEPVRGQVQGAVEELSALAAAVAERDEQDRRALEAQRRAARGELGELARGRSALAAYAAEGRGARMQDREA
jgi:hypothetical protein